MFPAQQHRTSAQTPTTIPIANSPAFANSSAQTRNPLKYHSTLSRRADKLDLDKENRAPRSMAQVGKKLGTPGRPQRQKNQFFEIGKVGRKTGITLPDTGVRDEHGLEPVSHLFSSPIASPYHGDRTLTSGEMQESSVPDVDFTIASRKTPRLPPARSSTPKHTNIGSPKRMSTGRPSQHPLSTEMAFSPSRARTQPQTNRLINFGDVVHRSIEEKSPFKPRHALRRSVLPVQEDESASPEPDANAFARARRSEGVDEAVGGAPFEIDPALELEDGPLMVGDDNDDYDEPQQPSAEFEDLPAEDVHETPVGRATAIRRSGGSTRHSEVSNLLQSAKARQGSKRARSSLEGALDGPVDDISISQLSASEPAQKRQRASPSKRASLIIHQDDEDVNAEPADIAYGDEYVAEEINPPAEEENSQPAAKGKGKGKGKKNKPAAPRERDANRAMRDPDGHVRINDSPSKTRQARGASSGPISNVHLRATTPFEDANERTSRFGRNLIQPLKFWANESRIWKHGQCEGIVRADDVEKPKRRGLKKKKLPGRKAKNGSEDATGDSDTESTLADEWEEDVGVIAGPVASWDPETQLGNVEELIHEDVAFASSSIVTRDVANSEFKYAKVMTLPFFGSGVVELPPEGYKRAKNSRKMQMCFFVHQGKVLVEVGAVGASETNQFAISKGGVFVVPRGNNYAITNESHTKTARIFFAQGCEAAGDLEKQ